MYNKDMGKTVSVVFIVKNAESTFEKSLRSVKFADEIVVVDNGSSDKTREIANRFNAHIFENKADDLGVLRRYSLEKATSAWILILDADEVVSDDLGNEIQDLLSKDTQPFKLYSIAFLNHFLGRPLHFGGENYRKTILFEKKAGVINDAYIHEKVDPKGQDVGNLVGVVYHYSYQSLGQLFGKFTAYAKRSAREKERQGEISNVHKLITYPINLFLARFIRDKGYKDGLFRLPLDIAFAYMEFLTYFLLLTHSSKK